MNGQKRKKVIEKVKESSTEIEWLKEKDTLNEIM